MIDLEIIKLLEKELKISLEGKEDFWKNRNSYKIDKNGFVTGLNLHGANLTKIPYNILKLKKLRHLDLSHSFIKDISPLLNLEKLENLHLEGNNNLSDESLIEFVNKAPKLKIFDFFGSWFHTIFPKDLLNHNLLLITREFGDEETALYMEDYDVFPPLPMLELGYNNP